VTICSIVVIYMYTQLQRSTNRKSCIIANDLEWPLVEVISVIRNLSSAIVSKTTAYISFMKLVNKPNKPNN